MYCSFHKTRKRWLNLTLITKALITYNHISITFSMQMEKYSSELRKYLFFYSQFLFESQSPPTTLQIKSSTLNQNFWMQSLMALHSPTASKSCHAHWQNWFALVKGTCLIHKCTPELTCFSHKVVNKRRVTGLSCGVVPRSWITRRICPIHT